MLDEPVNGLDPDGITWIRRLTRQLADEGRTVFLSLHLMSEMELRPRTTSSSWGAGGCSPTPR